MAGNEIAHNPPFAVGHYFLHLHYHRSQIGSGCMLRPLLHLSVPCPRVRPPFNLGTLISVVMREMPWIRGGYALGHPYLRTFGPVIFLDTTVNSYSSTVPGLTIRPLRPPLVLIVPETVQLVTTRR